MPRGRWLAMRAVGRFLQFAGLAALPIGMVMEVTGGLGRAFGVSQLVILMVFGFAAFYLGRLVEGYAAK
jgi:hypothetical protein